MSKAYCEACDRNRGPILTVIKNLFSRTRCVLEIGSGTGQHAVYFAQHLPHLVWYTSDKRENHADIQMWLDDARLANLLPPIDLNVTQLQWPRLNVDAVFSSNTVHIMHWHEVVAFFRCVGELLPAHGLFVLYGPFNYNNEYTSTSNADFDRWLKQRDPDSGIRDFEALDGLAATAGMELKQDHAMPANNRLLCWSKNAS